MDFLVCARQGNIIFRYKIPQIPLTTNNSTIVYKTIGTAHLVLPAIKLEYLLGKYLSTSFTDILQRHYNSDFLDIKQNHQMSRPIIQQTIILNICVRFLKFRPFMKRWMDFSKTPLMLQTSRMTKTDFPPFYFPRGSHEAVLGMYVVRAQGGPI